LDPTKLVKVKVTKPKLPKSSKQALDLIAKQTGKADKRAEQPSAAEQTQQTGEQQDASPVPAGVQQQPLSRWLWLGGAVLVLMLLGVAVWWWLRRRRKAKDASSPPGPPPGPSAYDEWRTFQRQLPADLARALVDFQPLILLAEEEAERDRVAEQLGHHTDQYKRFGDPVRLEGQALRAYLGDRTLILAPTGELLFGKKPVAESDWGKVLSRVCRARAPRVVVAIPPTLLDDGGEQVLAQYAGRLREHVDFIASVRGADVELSVVVPQQVSPLAISRKSTTTEALFELIRTVRDTEGPNCQRFDLSGVEFEGDESHRRASGATTARAWLGRYRPAWLRLLAREGQGAGATLALVQLFENLERLGASLGGILADLLNRPQRATFRGLGTELVWLPSRGTELLGDVAAFDGPESGSDSRWYPSALLKHRLISVSLASVLSLFVYAKYTYDCAYWDEAMTAALRYSPPGEANEIKTVRDYYFDDMNGLASFFNSDRPVDCVVHKTRQLLHTQILREAGTASPERLLQLLSLYLTSEPNACGIDESTEFKRYEELAKIILDNVDEWQYLTKLDAGEVINYLELACPNEHARLDELEPFESCGANPSCRGHWQRVPSADKLVEAMVGLRDSCQLGASERQNAENVGRLAYQINEIGRRHGAAYPTFQMVASIGTETMVSLERMFAPYKTRLERINQLDVEDSDLQLLTSDVRPFFGGKSRHIDTLGELDDRLTELISAQPPGDEDAIVRLSLGDESHRVDRRRMWSSLLIFASLDAFDEFEQTADASFPGGPFFETPAVADQATSIVRLTSGAGVTAKTQLPLRYTRAAYERYVQHDLERLANLEQQVTCSDEAQDPPTTHPRAEQLNDSIRQTLTTYDNAYAKQWRRVYDSFALQTTSRTAFERALEILSGPASPQLALMREVVTNTQLPVDAESPFNQSMASTRATFTTLAPALDPKVFGGYQALLQDLLAAVQAIPGPSMACPKADGEPPKDAAAAVALFSSGLSDFAKMQLSGTVDPSVDLHARLDAWLKDAAIPGSLQAPFKSPFASASSLGVDELRYEWTQCWFKSRKAELHGELLDRFPFSRDSHELADPEAVVRWLHPTDGRLAVEVESVLQALGGCEACGFAKNDADVERLQKARSLLFDDSGKPVPIQYQLTPMEMSPTLLAARFTQGECQVPFRNTAVEPVRCSFDWSDQQSFDLALTTPWGRFSSATNSSNWRLLAAFRDGSLPSGGVGLGLVGEGLDACTEQCLTTNLDVRIDQDIARATESTELWKPGTEAVAAAQQELQAARARLDAAQARFDALGSGSSGSGREDANSQALERARRDLEEATARADRARAGSTAAQDTQRHERQHISRARAAARQQAEQSPGDWVQNYSAAFRSECQSCGVRLVDAYLAKYGDEFERQQARLNQDPQLGCTHACDSLTVTYQPCVGPKQQCKRSFAELLK
jgi:hypothetical protein